MVAFLAGKPKALKSSFFAGASLSHPSSTRKAKPLRGAAQPCGFPPGAIPSGHQKKEKRSRGFGKSRRGRRSYHEKGH